MASADYDVLIVGAGLSGVNAAYRLQTKLPKKSFAVLEARARIGGTWDFWKYPGVRCDSRMALLAYPWHAWSSDRAMATGPDIRQYIEDAAVEKNLYGKICFRHHVRDVRWDSGEGRWTVTADVEGERKVFRAGFLINAAGYYSYEKPRPSQILGLERFAGEVVHPHFWDDKTHFADKTVVLIGSGATAVTLLPALAKSAKKVTVLQRSPSYVMAVDGRDRITPYLRRILPLSWAVRLSWASSMLTELVFVNFLSSFPEFGRKIVMRQMSIRLPADIRVEKHFNPRYKPWEQRLCFCPDADFFKALGQTNVAIATDDIVTVTAAGIQLRSGDFLEADMIITATGLRMELLGGVPTYVDGEMVNDSIGSRFVWNGSMIEGIPNAGHMLGYTQGTWTPGADVRTRHLIRVMRHMERTGAKVARPFITPEVRKKLPRKSPVPLTSTYVLDAIGRLPMSADVGAWRNPKDWLSDMWFLILGKVTDGMRFEK